MRTHVKICGITRPEDAMAAAGAGADAIGLVFYPPSPRFVTIDRAVELRNALPPFVQSVALFVNPGRAQVEEVIKNLKESLRALDEVMEILDDAQRQQIGDEKEIESLRRSLSVLQRERYSPPREQPRSRPAEQRPPADLPE